jgi:hypothetical protein
VAYISGHDAYTIYYRRRYRVKNVENGSEDDMRCSSFDTTHLTIIMQGGV